MSGASGCTSMMRIVCALSSRTGAVAGWAMLLALAALLAGPAAGPSGAACDGVTPRCGLMEMPQ